MDLNSSIVDFLSQEYSGSLAVRALWQWAGGTPEEVDFSVPPGSIKDQWTVLWQKAAEGGSANRTALVRQALLDQPGTELLLKFLFYSSREGFFEERRQALVLLDYLKSHAPEFDKMPLYFLFEQMPVVKEEPLFAALVPLFSNQFTTAERQALAERFKIEWSTPLLYCYLQRPSNIPQIARAVLHCLWGTLGSDD